MHEGDPGVANTDARLLIDQLDAGVPELAQDVVDVVDGVGDVVEPGTALLEVLADRRLRTQRPEELDVAVADVEERGLDTLRLHRLAVRERHAEGLLVDSEGCLEIVGGDADVVDPAEHGLGSLRSRERIARRGLAVRLLLDTQDLAKRRHPDLELLRRGLLGGDQPLDLVPRAMERPGGGRLRIALAPGEHLRGQ
jgi:hypothetical protein